MRIQPSTNPVFDQIKNRTVEAPPASAASNGDSFQATLSDSIKEVAQLQAQADTLSAQAAMGQVDDISQAMVAMEKAQLALELTVQVRNKLIEAYREVMRMPL